MNEWQEEPATLLVIDDIPDNLKILFKLFERSGYKVLVSTHGDEGFKIAKEVHPDLILLDIMMPTTDGFEVCNWLKNHPLTAAIPVIFMSAMNESDSKLKAFEIGAADYIIKPFQRQEVLARVNTHISLNRQQQQLKQQNQRLQQEIKQRQKAEDELRLAAAVFETASEAIVVSDEFNRIITVNPAFTQITGYAKEDVVGQNPSVLNSGRQQADFYKNMWHILQDTGRWQGEIWNKRKDGSDYAEWLSISTIRDENNKIIQFVAVFYDVTERKQYEALIHYQATYDSLTDLPNRNLFMKRLEKAIQEALKQPAPLALMFIDLDKFKWVNDNLGHNCGDEVLKEVARRLQQSVRASDMVARLGGDEFVIFLPRITACETIKMVAERILEALREPIVTTQQVVRQISVSIGITLCPQDASDKLQLIHYADEAMYAAKQAGRDQFRFYADECTQQILNQSPDQ